MSIIDDLYEAACMWVIEGELYEEEMKQAFAEALKNYKRPRVVVKLGNGHWLCSSDSRPGDYHSIEYVGGSEYLSSCECQQFRGNMECDHVTTIREVEQHV